MTTHASADYLQSLGARILGEANDLKRSTEELAGELGVEAETVAKVIAGEADVETARRLVSSMCERYPVSFANLWLEPDDTDEGVKLMTAAEALRSRHISVRPNGSGGRDPYVEYRDSAMSRSAPFKAEWILALRRVDSAAPYHRDVLMNKGHVLHQVTFILGPVNFYWEVGGVRHCAELDIGDSNFIAPFVPHSFTRRDPDRPALLVAVTYGGAVRNALTDFAHIGPAAAAELAGNLRELERAVAARIARHLAMNMVSVERFVGMLGQSGVARERALALVDGALPSQRELEMIGGVLGVCPRDLMIDAIAPEEEVIVIRRRDATQWLYPRESEPAYRMTDLARSRHKPHVRSFDVEVLATSASELRHHLHEYLYNHGSTPVILAWGTERRAVLNPGDSAHLLPMVNHRIERLPGDAPGRILMTRVAGKLTDEVLDEFATFPAESRSRVSRETSRWW